ncbi:hypothetical protein Cflav_PD0966 [Pedosphaera parvula Ellin514]|uniref:Uncharacterized protein n=1 Tax=Pedosphaera parvula (strain Ellin514) TaxID=320771 RepID=B9XQ83_PEDPL|nr:hypothetical protein Cflav_PD0966 [Pedosphaera parvula Ellin514]
MLKNAETVREPAYSNAQAQKMVKGPCCQSGNNLSLYVVATTRILGSRLLSLVYLFR